MPDPHEDTSFASNAEGNKPRVSKTRGALQDSESRYVLGVASIVVQSLPKHLERGFRPPWITSLRNQRSSASRPRLWCCNTRAEWEIARSPDRSQKPHCSG